MKSFLKIITKETFDNQRLVDKIKEDYTPISTDEVNQEFEAACENFRNVCKDIETATGLVGFKGGFDEMLTFQNTSVASTPAGLVLAMRWSAADKLCTYIADKKLKIGQPAWWKRCWGIEE